MVYNYKYKYKYKFVMLRRCYIKRLNNIKSCSVKSDLKLLVQFTYS